MLSELQRLHGEILANLDQLDALTAMVQPPMDRLPGVRLALTRASRARTLLLERLHGELVRGADAATRAALDALQVEGKANMVRSAQHIGSWTLREVVNRWPDYCAASHTMRRAMRERIARERRLVYPLLGRAEGKAA